MSGTADKLRSMMSWALIAAGPALSVMNMYLVYILVWGPWEASTAMQRLQSIGMTLMLQMAALCGVIGGIAIGGPVGRIRGKVLGNEMELDRVSTPS